MSLIVDLIGHDDHEAGVVIPSMIADNKSSFEVVSQRKEICISYVSYFTNFLSADSAILVQRLYLYNLVLQLKHLSKASFFSYKGSLTTPPCYQSVSWIVLKEPIAASEDDVRTFFK